MVAIITLKLAHNLELGMHQLIRCQSERDNMHY